MNPTTLVVSEIAEGGRGMSNMDGTKADGDDYVREDVESVGSGLIHVYTACNGQLGTFRVDR